MSRPSEEETRDNPASSHASNADGVGAESWLANREMSSPDGEFRSADESIPNQGPDEDDQGEGWAESNMASQRPRPGLGYQGEVTVGLNNTHLHHNT